MMKEAFDSGEVTMKTTARARQRPADANLAIIGGGNIGLALARGLVAAGLYPADRITITRRQVHLLAATGREGYRVQRDNHRAVAGARVVVVAVQPQQVAAVLDEIRGDLAPAQHIVISLVSGVTVADLRRYLGAALPVVRAMPNTAIAIRESMTCLASDANGSEALEVAARLFDAVGKTLVIPEELMIPATALCACGIAFFLRAVRAASQGGIEIGFHPEDALLLSSQTAKGAAALLLAATAHPESEIDKVTTPRGCTIAGLNHMEHEGFSSAMIKGITISAEKAAHLYEGPLEPDPEARRSRRAPRAWLAAGRIPRMARAASHILSGDPRAMLAAFKGGACHLTRHSTRPPTTAAARSRVATPAPAVRVRLHRKGDVCTRPGSCFRCSCWLSQASCWRRRGSCRRRRPRPQPARLRRPPRRGRSRFPADAAAPRPRPSSTSSSSA
jgi:pyrroline-5-carboxylate reductase